MQSENKSPYLSQYKDDVSAQQKAIRQRLYGSSSDNKSPRGSRLQLERDNIPSIDDEFVEQVSQERRYKSRFSYFDDEAEASLQFFKKNLMPQSEAKSTKPATSSLFDRPPLLSSRSQQQEPSNQLKTTFLKKVPSSAIEHNNTEYGAGGRKYQIGSSRPVPFKQTSLNNEPKIDRTTAKQIQTTTIKDKPTYSNNNNGSAYVSRQERSSAPSNENSSHREPVASYRARSSDRQRSKTPLQSFERGMSPNGNNNANQTVESSLNFTSTPNNRGQSPDGPPRSTTDSPAGTFSRKPIYGSLLRAHDSIRLKVNRPKVRPKSEGPIKDTEVDDSISLTEMNSKSSPNERAVDIKRSSSRKSKSKKKDKESKASKEYNSKEKLPVRNFSEVRIVKVVRNENERSIGVTVKAEDGNIVVARIMAGSLADKQGALQVGDIILAVNNREVYTPEQLQEELRKSISDDTVIFKIVPSFREELPTLCIYLRALFSYDANEDSLLPCKEVGISFNQGDILEVVNQEDPNWWQARRVDSENLQTGLIPSQDLEERRRAFVSPDYDMATRTSIFGTKVLRKSRRKEIYNIGQNNDFDKAEMQLYEEVCRTPAFERRTLVLIGANGVGKQALKARLVSMDPDRFGTPLPHTSRLPREGEEEGIHYHFVTREMMEEDILAGRYLEYGEYEGALYGTKLDSVRAIIGAGKVCVLDCSPTCLKVLKTSDYLPFVAFIAAPTLDQLRYMHEWARSGNRNYTTLERSLSRQSRRARTLQDFAFDFFEEEDLQLTIEESARLFRMYENYFDIVLVNNNFEMTFSQLKEAIDALSMAPQWIPISWIYGT